MKKIIVTAFITILTVAIHFLVTAYVLKFMFWAFDLHYTVKTAFGIWLLLWLIKCDWHIEIGKRGD